MAKNNKSIQGGTMNQMMKNVSKEMQKQETAEQRKEDIANLHLVCEALCARINEVINITLEAQKSKRKIYKTDIAISIPIIYKYLDDNGISYDQTQMQRISMLTNILIDIARCQINSKLSSYHVNIRQLYFSEKFYGYFGTGYIEDQNNLVDSYPQLFNTWDVTCCYFESTVNGKTTYLKVPINQTGTMNKLKLQDIGPKLDDPEIPTNSFDPDPQQDEMPGGKEELDDMDRAREEAASEEEE